jgi:hypothetical protein
MTPYATAVFALIDGLRAVFPRLEIEVQQDHPEVELSIDISRQAGLPFAMNLNLQEDELYLRVGGFCCSTIPAINPTCFN